MSSDYAELEEVIGYQFDNKDWLEEALSHSSRDCVKSYERLEFLGDRVLGLIIADYLYDTFPKEAEGDLAKRLAALVQGTLLARIAREIGLGEFIHFSDSEKTAGGANNDNILADVMEALLGAIYKDAGAVKGYEICRRFILEHWNAHFDVMVEPPQHPKTRLQEWAQSKGLDLPVYAIEKQSGPDHAPEFTVSVSVEGYKKVEATGRSRQQAEKDVAAQFMKQIDKKL